MSAPSVIQYPYGETISKKDAVDLIRLVIYPKENKKYAGNLIYGRIRTAQQQGVLPVAKLYQADKFFRWAVKKWPKLEHLVKNLPIDANFYGVSRMDPGHVYVKADLHEFHIPADYEGLREEYVKLLIANDFLKDRLAKCERQLDAHAARREERSSKIRRGIKDNKP